MAEDRVQWTPCALPFSYIAITFWRLINFPFSVKIIAFLFG